MPSRRRFLTLVAFAVPVRSARAQRTDRRRIGVLMGGLHDEAWEVALREGLAQRGWHDGRNLVVEYRWGEGDETTMRSQAADLVQRKPDLLLVRSATALREARRVAGPIPIVFLNVSDPVGNGFVANLARPGGTITGFSNFDHDIAGKWLQLLRELAPRAHRVFVLQSRNNPNWRGWLRSIEAAAPALGFVVVKANLTRRDEVEPSLAAFARETGGALVVLPDPLLAPLRDRIVALAARHRLPAVYGGSVFENGQGLVYYGADSVDLARNAAGYIDRIFRGESAGSLPVQAPKKFSLVINASVARALGLDVPASLRSLADRVID